LFCALESKADLAVIKLLVHHDPESVLLTQYKLGRTPIHAAVASGNDLDIIHYLLELRPLALAEQDAWGKTPLACACAYHNQDNDVNQLAVVRRLIDSTRIRKTDRAGMLPLHIACQNGAGLDCLHLLLDAYPVAIKMGDKNGRLPLHAACTNPKTEPQVLAFLIQAYPDALKTFDKTGSLPLHLSIQRRLPTRTVLYIMSMAEGAARTKEASSQMYALHMACRANADESLIERLIQVYPEAIDAVDVEGNTFFHAACRNKAMDIDFVQLLLDKCSYQIMKQCNKDGCLPLHIACQSRLSYDVIALMVEYYPQGLMAVDTKGNTPLHKAFQCCSTELKTLVRLAQLEHRALYKRNKRGDRPEDCVGPLVQKRFRRARLWYNARVAYCPVCIWHKE
jgi:ankyrin repeat protein